MARLSKEELKFRAENIRLETIRIQELELEVEDLVEMDSFALILYSMYYLHIAEKSKIKEEFIKRNIEDRFDDAIRELEENLYIKEFKISGEISGGSVKFIKETDFTMEYLVENYDILTDYIESTKGEIVSGFKKIINQHTSIEHYASIYALEKICERENIKYFNNAEDVVLRIENNHKNLRKTYTKSEFDLVAIYNRKKFYFEVERGTTSYSDMTSKMDKINLLSDDVVIVCPNQKILDSTRKKIEKWEEEYEERYAREEVDKIRNLKILYINISAIKDKKGKKLGNKLKDFMKKDFYLI